MDSFYYNINEYNCQVNRSHSQVWNNPQINHDEIEKENKFSKSENKKTVNLIKNISVFSRFKPFYFPPPDLGVVESMGSFENSSRFFRSAKSSNLNQSYWNKTKNADKSKSPQKEVKIADVLRNLEVGHLDNLRNISKSNQEQIVQSEDREIEIISIGSLNSEDSKLEYSEPTSCSNEEENQDPSSNVQINENDNQECGLDDLSTESYYLLEGNIKYHF